MTVSLLDQGRINRTFFEFCENTVSGDRLFGLVLLPLDSFDYCCWALRGVWSGDSLPLAECQNILASQSAVNHLLAMRQEWGWWGDGEWGAGGWQCGKESQCYKGKQHEKKTSEFESKCRIRCLWCKSHRMFSDFRERSHCCDELGWYFAPCHFGARQDTFGWEPADGSVTK